jgi:hypothetical protein
MNYSTIDAARRDALDIEAILAVEDFMGRMETTLGMKRFVIARALKAACTVCVDRERAERVILRLT